MGCTTGVLILTYLQIVTNPFVIRLINAAPEDCTEEFNSNWLDQLEDYNPYGNTTHPISCHLETTRYGEVFSAGAQCKNPNAVVFRLEDLLRDESSPSLLGSWKTVELSLPENSSNIIIPCRTIHWNAPVLLTKTDDSEFYKLSTDSNSSYDPPSGFSIMSETSQRLVGDYLCSDFLGGPSNVTFHVRSSLEIESRVQRQVVLDKNGTISCVGGETTNWVVRIIYTNSPGQAKILKKCFNRMVNCRGIEKSCEYIPGECQINRMSGLVNCEEKDGMMRTNTVEFTKGVDNRYYALDAQMSIPAVGLINMTLTVVSQDDTNTTTLIESGSAITEGKYNISCHFSDYIFARYNTSVRLYSTNGPVMDIQLNPEDLLSTPSKRFIFVDLNSSHTGISCVGVWTHNLSEKIEAMPIKVSNFTLGHEQQDSKAFSIIFGFVLSLIIATIICLLMLRRWVQLNKQYVQTANELREFKYGKPMPIESCGMEPSELNRIELNEIAWTSNSMIDHENGNEIAMRKTNRDHDYDPYDKTYEIHDFIIGENELGSGTYGVVKGGIVNGQKVAVKTCRLPVDKMCLESLKSELKLLISIQNEKDKEDKNILRLIGANTKKLRTGELYIFLEYCELGNLEKYLYDFVKEGAGTELLNTQVGTYFLATNTKKSLPYRRLALWSFQIANGMEYLASKKVIHIDLAARNILLSDEETVKICDFGLSRKLIQSLYIKENSKLLPLQWLAPESLNKEKIIFSTKSDVWSYGVTLWEIYSLAVAEPALAHDWDSLRTALIDGKRLGLPKYASHDIYSTMLKCWDLKPENRPSFVELKSFFQCVIEDSIADLEVTI